MRVTWYEGGAPTAIRERSEASETEKCDSLVHDGDDFVCIYQGEEVARIDEEDDWSNLANSAYEQETEVTLRNGEKLSCEFIASGLARKEGFGEHFGEGYVHERGKVFGIECNSEFMAMEEVERIDGHPTIDEYRSNS